MFDSNDRFPGDSPIPAAEEPDQGQAEPLLRQYGNLDAEAMLKVMIGDVFPGRIAVTTSFGTEAAVHGPRGLPRGLRQGRPGNLRTA